MLAFLPALAPIVLGAELKMPNVATWWLGRADMREEMLGKARQHGRSRRPSPNNSPIARHGSEILGAKLDGRAARGAHAIDPRPWHRLCGSGSRDAVEHAGMARRALAAAAIHAAAVPRQSRRTMAGHARRLRAHRRKCRCTRGKFAARRGNGRRLGAGARSGGRNDAAADAGAHAGAARHRAVCRAEPPTICSGSGAMWNAPRRRCGWCARSSIALPRPTMRPRRSLPASAPCSAPGTPSRAIPISAPATFTARAALTRADLEGALAAPGRRRPRGRLRHPRPFLAGCLAGYQRSRQVDCGAAGDRTGRKRDRRARRSGAAHHLVAVRAWRRKT